MGILITGGTGLIGSEIVRQLLARGERVVVLSRQMPNAVSRLFPPGVEAMRVDIRDALEVREAVRESGADRILHLAACLSEECDREPDMAVSVNVDGTLNLLTAAVANEVRRFVFASSIALYGPGDIVFEEDTLPIGPVRLYGQTKQLGEALCARYQELQGLDYVALRYGGVFGPGGEVRNSGMSGLRHLLKQTMWGQDVVLEGASGEECFQYIYAKDAARASLLALDCPALQHRCYNIAGPLENYISLKAFHAAIRNVAPQAGQARFVGRSQSGLRVSIDRIRNDLGFSPTLSVEDGLRDEYRRSLN